MKCHWTTFSRSVGLLILLFFMGSAAWAQDPCQGALIGTTTPALGTAKGCGVIITVTAVDDGGNATAFTTFVPNGGNGNPYDGPPFSVEGDHSDDTLVGIVNKSGTGLNSITLTSPNLTFGGAFAFDGDGPCDYAGSVYDSSQDCFDGATGYEGPNNSFSTPTGPPLCGEGFTCPTTATVNFGGEGGLPNGSSTWFALEGTPASLTLVQQAILTFTPDHPSAVATFNCSTDTRPCPDPGAHSMKFTLNSVSNQFSITLLAEEVDGDGVCESGTPGDPTDPIDCRFVNFFGEPGTPPAVNVPLCYAYSSLTPHCVFYSVQGAPTPPGQTDSPYTGPVLEQIAWNTLETPPAGYVNSPRMYDDPSDDHDTHNYYPMIPGFPYPSTTPEDNQFVFDITTFFNPNPGTVGTDPTTGGKTKTFNDFVIAFPLTLAQVQQPVNSDGSSVFNAKRGVIPLKFSLLQDGVATCNLPPATITLDRLVGTALPGSITESTYSMSADSGSNFRISGCQYLYNLAASALGTGQYKVGVVIDPAVAGIGSEVVGIAYFELK